MGSDNQFDENAPLFPFCTCFGGSLCLTVLSSCTSSIVSQCNLLHRTMVSSPRKHYGQGHNGAWWQLCRGRLRHLIFQQLGRNLRRKHLSAVGSNGNCERLRY